MKKFTPLNRVMIEDVLRAAFKEDLGIGGDATTRAVIDDDIAATVAINARETGVLSGIDVARLAFELIDSDLKVEMHKADGDKIVKGDALMVISGRMASILTAERIALNFLGRMCGIATLTHRMVEAAKPYTPRIACTRKTTPNLRMFEKYAVRCGGGSQHRLGLDDCIMIKDNHIAANGGDLEKTLKRARDYAGHTTKIEVEVDTLDQLKQVLAVDIADIIMLDNMSPEDMKTAVDLVGGRAVLEASGGITLDTINAKASSGVDVISIGALTHSAPNFDVGLDFQSKAELSVVRGSLG